MFPTITGGGIELGAGRMRHQVRTDFQPRNMPVEPKRVDREIVPAGGTAVIFIRVIAVVDRVGGEAEKTLGDIGLLFAGVRSPGIHDRDFGGSLFQPGLPLPEFLRSGLTGSALLLPYH